MTVKDVAADALCRIVSVTVYPPHLRAVAVGELRTSLGETFGLFNQEVLAVAMDARSDQQRVLLDVRKSKAGHRYVKAITVLDPSRDPTPCLRCDAMAVKVDGTPEIPAHYACPSCHSLWFLEPITRSYAP